jgi:hypothetical protein
MFIFIILSMLSLARMVTISARQNGHKGQGRSKADRPETPHIEGQGSLAERTRARFSHDGIE